MSVEKNIALDGVSFIRLQFVDLFGTPKNIEIPKSRFDDVFEKGVAFDGSSVEGFVRISESDMRLIPQEDTLVKHSWEPDTASVICDVYRTDGTPFEGCPRNVLKKQLAKLDGEFSVGPEPEFFLLKKGQVETADQGGYFDLKPLDEGEKVRQKMIRHLDLMKFEVEAGHHEVAPGQHEIDFKYAEGLQTADRLMRFKTIIKEIALRYGYNATFMPKPFAGMNGSGMHCHMSVWRDGKNTFYDGAKPFNLSEEARYFIGGLLTHVKGLCALTNPLINSYKRLVPGYEAPVNICWGRKNRSALIRVPDVGNVPEATRFEMRNPDPGCNPYLTFAAILAAGMDGVENKIEPPDAVEDSLYDMSLQERYERGIDSVPSNLEAAVEALCKDKVLCDALGSHVVDKFVEAKRKEITEYRVNVSDWERDKYLNC